MIQIIWEFRVKETIRAEFLRYYSSTGSWATPFRKNPEHRGTKLLHDTQNENRYVTIDIWENKESFKSFIKKLGEEYETLDKACEGFTEIQPRIGAFNLIET